MTEVSQKSKRGFASMSPEKQREIARKGGLSVRPENRTFSRDRKLASRAGTKGGQTSHGGTADGINKTIGGGSGGLSTGGAGDV